MRKSVIIMSAVAAAIMLPAAMTAAPMGSAAESVTESGAPASASKIDTVTVRVKAMRCDDCAHKVYVALTKDPGVDDVDFNLERRTVTVAYDPALTCPDSINAHLLATKRFRPTPYSKDEVIKRGYGQRIADMYCQKCANRIVAGLQDKPGIDSLAPRLDKGYLFIRYDANRTCRDSIRKVINGMGYTPVNYYSSDKVAYAYYLIPEAAATQETIDKIKEMRPVDDANVNPRRKTLAVTYFCEEISADKLLEAIKAKGIDAKLPPKHECKEEAKASSN